MLARRNPDQTRIHSVPLPNLRKSRTPAICKQQRKRIASNVIRFMRTIVNPFLARFCQTDAMSSPDPILAMQCAAGPHREQTFLC